MIKTFTKLLGTCATLSLITMSGVSHAADCSSNPVNPNGNTSQLQNALQQATNTGKALRLTGTYYISSDTKVYLKKDLVVDATGAKFIATSNLDGDMFSFDAHTTKSNECNSANTLANFTWKGGDFNMANAKVSKVVPITSKTPAGREGTASTADALSIRGANNSNNTNKVNVLLIENITFTGTKNSNDPYYLAGGDSGILMTGTLKATIRNNKFYGVRDAAVYLSAGGDRGQYGDHFTISNNHVERAYDAFTSKRGADNIKMNNNTMDDVIVGLSIKRVYDGWTATNVKILNNTITNAVRPISVERANNVTITGNHISGLGAVVGGSTRATNIYGQQYEGIALNGVQGTNLVSGNTIKGITGVASRESETTTWGIVTREEDGRETTGDTITNNTFSKLDKWVKRL
ncbi:right-handed parallel beta-helix repeat-containing protein [Algibacillus agarilyticus]|uniref:right-handed parallel beta-helix repeat-containing protein n=1 Tax=Algibacillus agarilyticus TaxID=2234133 RepID=UPI000DD09E37|nr:right-handed parallel beta-helix repeat-containing protein [Algibacillus agarilyticus]